MDHPKAHHRTFDDEITWNLKKCNILTRPNASHGFWVSWLLPVTLCICSLSLDTSEIFKLATTLSVSLGLVSTVFFIFTSITDENLLKWNDILFPSLLSILLLIIFNARGIPFSLVTGFAICIGYKYCLRLILMNCLSSFTLGEAMLVGQSVILFIFTTVFNAYSSIFNVPQNDHDIITIILQIGILSVMAVVMTLFSIHKEIHLQNFGVVVGFYIGLMLTILHILLDRSPILWIVLYVFDNMQRISMIVYWIIASVMGIIAVNRQISVDRKASTSQRKIFHLLAVAVYLPGVLHECNLVYLASGIAIAALVALETVRKLNLGWFSQVLNDGFKVFSDEKDAGGLSITPIYLLLGISCPIFLHPSSCHRNAALLSGILSIGIGDTAASYFGSNYGKHKWPGSSRSVEGTVANFIFQMATISFLCNAGYIKCNMAAIVLYVISVVVNCTVEALTDQVDNLMLPLITFSLLVLV